ncbi:amidohydrolase family protein [Duganella sp. FT50W]|uniref:Amidohydrolase family protein n=1 Tax=Duganella lactea TaxID=2692173 RepID=A0A6L8MMF4_9BURK|nr:amidohydrolase family protein [Duganella lactea]MYM33056.1 amidohydrolase family protein [Duganella lactea]MYM80458.1 amidohydrolase family protein [Duganella lactea]
MKFPQFIVSLLMCAPAMAGQTWITNVKLVSPEKLDRIESGSVLIENERIVRVERGADNRTPAGATRVDGQGYYLTPGLIDSHVHLFAVPGMSFEQSEHMQAMADAYFAQMPRSYLYYGYTTVIDLAAGSRAFIDRVKAMPLHPDIYDCGAPLVIANGYPSAFIAPAKRFQMFSNFIYDAAQKDKIPAQYKPEDYTVAQGVARVKADHAICLKTHYERGFGSQRNLPVMSPEMYADVRRQAKQADLVLVTHANSLEAQTFAVNGGADVLAHGMWHWGALNNSKELPEEVTTLLDKVVEKNIGYQPTMQVLYGLRAYVDPDYLNTPALAKLLPPAMLAWLKTPEGNWFKEEVAEEGETDEAVRQGMEAPLRRQRQVVAYLAGKNANFLFGTDTPSSPTYGNIPGLNGYLEMQNLRNAGLSLAQIFQAATINNARAFHLDRDLGTIEAGKVANLLLLKESPLQHIRAYDAVDTVWLRGKPVARDSLTAGGGD